MVSEISYPFIGCAVSGIITIIIIILIIIIIITPEWVHFAIMTD